MKITSRTNHIHSKKALHLVWSTLVLLMTMTAFPTFAQQQPVNNNAFGAMDDVNNNDAFRVRQNYGKRHPFMRDAVNQDALEKIDIGNNKWDKDGTIPTAADTGKLNLKRSRLLATPVDVPAYIPLIVPSMYYAQPPCIAHDKPKTMRDRELFHHQLTTFGVPMSDTQFQIIQRENFQRLLELLGDPERVLWTAQSQGQLGMASLANILAGSSEASWRQALERIVQADGNGSGGGAGGAQVGALINVANEQLGVPTAAGNPWKTVQQAVWMVQQMYKYVFVPMAILFLLPGAVMTQVKCQIVQGFKINAEDQSSPFEGILRAVIAIFLIPATQLIVSYSIDVGNSMAYSVKDWVNLQTILDWSRELTYNVPINNVDNGILKLGNNTDSGIGDETKEKRTIDERQLWLSTVMEVAFNMATYMFSSAIIVLGAYQLVFICYLFLLGPLAAAFFAWPKIQANSSQNLFRDVFSNWANAVIVVSLWRFYWMVILAIMTQRIMYIQDSGGATDLQWELAVFTCLLGLMLWVPFNPWSFDPAAAFQAVSTTGSQMMQGASQAMGAAAQQAGAPASQVQAAQNQVNQALQPLQSLGNAQLQASYGVVNPNEPLGSPYGQQGQSNNLTNQAAQLGTIVAPPPSASSAGNFATGSVDGAINAPARTGDAAGHQPPPLTQESSPSSAQVLPKPPALT